MSDKKDSSKHKAKAILQAGAKISGPAATTAAIAAMFGSERSATAAIIGAASSWPVTQLITKVLEFAYDQFSTEREMQRGGVVATFAINEIVRRLKNGNSIRGDGFVESPSNTALRSSAEELFEGCLQKARDCYIEKKVPFVGFVFASFLFDEGISSEEANQILTIAEELSFRQYCLIVIIKRQDQFAIPKIERLRELPETSQKIALYQEMVGLGSRYIYHVLKENGNVIIADSIAQITFDGAELTSFGERIYESLGLYTILDSEIEEVISQFP